jgi:serine-type D-Ala-D-Ala carboxypeptidase (penicillin-binding protein 5/6)
MIGIPSRAFWGSRRCPGTDIVEVSDIVLRIAVILVAMALLVPGPDTVRASSLPVVTAPEAIVMDGWTGAVLYAKNANVMRAPASTVKIMTALVILRHQVPLSRVVTVGATAVSYRGSTAGLYVGERMTVWNLLHGMLLPSGNDAAVALSQTLAATPLQFAHLMNLQAARLHLWHTHYLSPNGFDTPGQVTTARDLANLTRVAMQSSTFDAIIDTKTWTARAADGRGVHVWQSLNRLLWSSKIVDGVKTGTTPAAGACLVSSARKGGRWVIAVNMGSTVAGRFTDGAALLNYGFAVDSFAPSTT